MDIWSLGCVLIETALWVTADERERVAFQQRRRDENDLVSPIQRGLGRSDCFHNGKEKLKTVSDVYDFVRRHGRRCDELTPEIVSFVLDHVLVEEDQRYPVKVISTELDKLIRTSRETVYGSSMGGSNASSADLSQRSRERNTLYSNEYVESHRTPMSSFTTGEQAWNTGWSRRDTLSPDRSQPTQRFPSMGLGFHENPKPYAIDLGGDPQEEPWNHHTAVQRPPSRNTVSLPEASLSPTAERSRQTNQQDATLIGIHGAAGPYQRIERQSGISSIDEETYMVDTHYPQGKSLHTPRPQVDARSHAQSDPSQWPTKRVETDKSSDSKATITQARQQDKTHAPRPSRSTFPRVSIAEVNERRILEKKMGYRRPLPGEDQAMALLKNRDFVSMTFLI